MSIPKYCSNCGKPIFAENKFCGSCGAKINYSFSGLNAENDGNNPPIIKKGLSAKTDPVNAQYLSVSSEKLAVLSVVTFGLYLLYWFYKNWRAVKEQEKLNISPFWRAFFAPLFAYSLFKIILATSQKQGYKDNYSSLFLAIVFIVFYIAWKFPDPWWIITFLVFVPLLPVQKAINFIDLKNNPNFKKNNDFSTDDESDLIKKGNVVNFVSVDKNDKFSIFDWIILLGALIMFPGFILEFLVSIFSNPSKIIINLSLLIISGLAINSRVVKYRKLNTEKKYKRFKKIIIAIFAVLVLLILLIIRSIVLISINNVNKQFYNTKEETIPSNSEPNKTSNWICGDIIAYSGQNYNTVQIGSQCWFKENLNVGVRIAGSSNASNNSIIEKYCYDNSDTDCATDGGLYQWDEVMAYSNTEGTQGICPNGWHIPKDSEWYTLENYLKDLGQTCSVFRNGIWDCATAGTKLKYGGTSVFEGILAGFRNINGSFPRSFLSRNAYANFWSSTENGSLVWIRGLSSSYPTVPMVYRGTFDKAYGLSVRCLKD